MIAVKEVKYTIKSVATEGGNVLLGLGKGAIRVAKTSVTEKLVAGDEVKLNIRDDKKVKAGEVIDGTFVGKVTAESKAPVRTSDRR